MVYARHLTENRASGRVILKNGFSYVGTEPIDIKGQSRTLECYEIRA